MSPLIQWSLSEPLTPMVRKKARALSLFFSLRWRAHTSWPPLRSSAKRYSPKKPVPPVKKTFILSNSYPQDSWSVSLRLISYYSKSRLLTFPTTSPILCTTTRPLLTVVLLFSEGMTLFGSIIKLPRLVWEVNIWTAVFYEKKDCIFVSAYGGH